MFVLTQPQISNNQWSIRCVKSWRSRYQTKAWKDTVITLFGAEVNQLWRFWWPRQFWVISILVVFISTNDFDNI